MAASDLKGRLTRKAGPLPVWAWIVVAVGGFLLYRRRQANSSGVSGTGSQTTAVPVSTSTSGTDSGAVSGSGSVADTGSGSSVASPVDLGTFYATNASTIDSLTNALLSMEALQASGPVDGGPPGASSQGTATAPTVNTSPSSGGAPPVKVGQNASTHTATQTTAGQLSWGGRVFTSKAAFDAWAKAHGTTTKAELSNHPQARQLYGTLR